MADLKWVCNQNCFIGGVYYSKGQIVLAATNPSATYFTETTNDSYRRPIGTPSVDLDGTLYYGTIGFEDFKFPLSSTKVGALNKPDYDFTNNGYLFPQNDNTEVLYASDQFPHSMNTSAGATGYPHLHVVQAANQQAVFKLKYRIIGRAQAVPEFITLTSTGYAYAYTSGSISQIITFPSISLAGVITSSLIDIQLYREDNVYTGDILVKSVDIHIPLDSLGSGQEFIK